MSRASWVAVFVMIGAAALYLPLAGTYPLWDPWEPHYAEVARQMLLRREGLALWWSGAPWEDGVFWSKPPLAFWGIALSWTAIGPGTSMDAILAGHRVEWAVRLPSVLWAAISLGAIAFVAARLAGRRTALFASLACATSPMFFLVARQAITDMPLIGCLCVASAAAALALWDPGRDAAPSRALRIGTWAALGVAIVPFLLHFAWALGPVAGVSRLEALPQVLPWFVVAAWLSVRLRRAASASARMWAVAGAFTGLGLLAKGLFGLLPMVVLVISLALTGGLRRLRAGDVGTAMLAGALSGLPWYHAQAVLYGAPFFREFIIEHHFARVQRGFGTFDDMTWVSYVRELGYAAFPWGPLALGAVALRPREGRRELAVFALVWAAVVLALVTTSLTRYNHYLLPMIPAVAILAGLYLDALLAGEVDGDPAVAIPLLVAAPLGGLALRDLVTTPASAERLLWLFDYSYKMPDLHDWPQEIDLALPIYALAFAALAGLALASIPAIRRAAVGIACAASIAFTLFALDAIVRPLAPLWSTRPMIEAWQRQRAPGEMLIAWFLFSRGETFYTANALWDPARPIEDQGVFHGADPAWERRFRVLLRRHAGQRIFVVTWRALEESPATQKAWHIGPFAASLPPEVRHTVRTVARNQHQVLLSFVAPPVASAGLPR